MPKLAVLPMLDYNSKVDNATSAKTLTKKVTLLTSGATTALTLPSSKGAKKEFIVIAAGASTVATVTAVSPDVIVSGASAAGAATSTVSNATVATFKALGGKWYRVG